MWCFIDRGKKNKHIVVINNHISIPYKDQNVYIDNIHETKNVLNSVPLVAS